MFCLPRPFFITNIKTNCNTFLKLWIRFSLFIFLNSRYFNKCRYPENMITIMTVIISKYVVDRESDLKNQYIYFVSFFNLQICHYRKKQALTIYTSPFSHLKLLDLGLNVVFIYLNLRPQQKHKVQLKLMFLSYLFTFVWKNAMS